MKKTNIFLLALIIIVFIIRLTSVSEFLYDDESNFAFSATVMNDWGFNEYYYSSWITNLLYKPLIPILGLEIWVFRLIPLLFGLINIGLVYLLAEELYSKKVAKWTIPLMLFSFYPTLASLQFDVEGNLIMTCAILTFYYLIKYQKSMESDKNRKIFYQILSGLFLGIAIFTKYNAAILSVIVAAIIILNNLKELNSIKKQPLLKIKSFTKQTFVDIVPIATTAFLACGIYVFAAYLSNPQGWWEFVSIVGQSRYTSSRFSIMGPAIYFIWATPLLIFPYILSLGEIISPKASLHQKEKKIINQTPNQNSHLLLIWITLTLLYYTFIICFGGHDRYFMHTIPALIILTAYWINKINWTKYKIIMFSISIFIWTTLLLMINSQSIKIIPRIPSLYFKEILEGNLAFLFSITSSSGPMLGISFATMAYTIIFTSLITAALILLIYTLKKTKKPKIKLVFQYCLILFFAMGFSFNLFLVTEYFFHPTTVDVSKAQWETVEFIEQENLSYPIYSNNEGILWYFDNKYWHNKENVMGFDDYESNHISKETIQKITENKGTIILVNWPPLPEGSSSYLITDLCEHTNSFKDKNYAVIEIYDC